MGLKPAYLISGDDDAKIDAWRSRVRRRAEDEGGPGSLELFDARTQDPGEVAGALAAMTFATGTRYLLADGAEAWKAGDLEPLEAGLGSMPPDTVLVLIARGKVPARLVKAVEKAGGEQRDYAAPKPWELPKWVRERAQEEGLELDSEASKALVAVVGQRQQRLARELERLAIEVHPQKRLSADDVVRLAAREASSGAYDLADALVARDVSATLRLAEDLIGRGEAPGRLTYPIVRRLRDVHRAAELLEAGLPDKAVAGELKMPPWAAKRTLAHAKKADRDQLARALCEFAALEVDLRGGLHGRGGQLDEDTAFSLTLVRSAA
ncbi:MAG: DNA polymerase III subunit delta [Gaiellaceae bacterium]